MAGGSVLDAAYLLLERMPQNEFALDLLETGFQTLMFVSWLPYDCQEWLRFEANQYHEGAGFGLVEMIFEVNPQHMKWLAYARNPPNGPKITVRSCPPSGPMRYEAQRNDWIGKNCPWEQWWLHPAHYDKCLALFSLWAELEIEKDMKQELEDLNDVLAQVDLGKLMT